MKTDDYVKTQERRINKEIKNLKKVMQDVPEDLLTAADGLIKRAAFMRITLEDYEEDLTKMGHTEMFTQSVNTDPYERERPTARLHISMAKNYQTTMQRLFELIPKKPADPVDPTYAKFFGGSNGSPQASSGGV